MMKGMPTGSVPSHAGVTIGRVIRPSRPSSNALFCPTTPAMNCMSVRRRAVVRTSRWVSSHNSKIGGCLPGSRRTNSGSGSPSRQGNMPMPKPARAADNWDSKLSNTPLSIMTNSFRFAGFSRVAGIVFAVLALSIGKLNIPQAEHAASPHESAAAVALNCFETWLDRPADFIAAVECMYKAWQIASCETQRYADSTRAAAGLARCGGIDRRTDSKLSRRVQSCGSSSSNARLMILSRSGVPQPVAKSQPGVALYPGTPLYPLLPTLMSRPILLKSPSPPIE
jgi:hypothetical protein